MLAKLPHRSQGTLSGGTLKGFFYREKGQNLQPLRCLPTLVCQILWPDAMAVYQTCEWRVSISACVCVCV